jgi:hypothetical protein
MKLRMMKYNEIGGADLKPLEEAESYPWGPYAGECRVGELPATLFLGYSDSQECPVVRVVTSAGTTWEWKVEDYNIDDATLFATWFPVEFNVSYLYFLGFEQVKA